MLYVSPYSFCCFTPLHLFCPCSRFLPSSSKRRIHAGLIQRPRRTIKRFFFPFPFLLQLLIIQVKQVIISGNSSPEILTKNGFHLYAYLVGLSVFLVLSLALNSQATHYYQCSRMLRPTPRDPPESKSWRWSWLDR